MKKLALALLLSFSLSLAAQEETFVDIGEPVPAVVYQAPVVYQVPVVYQAPVIYQAPVYFGSDYVEESYCPPSSPTVIYFGSRYNCGRNAEHCAPASSSTVIYFGRRQAARHGYQFRMCR